eukprot:TRINITY_DN583_c0_g1_i2.p1 TRINITY_DN583_c0_g1~~TRINITY_DN583_c0_g1_i2.p1  ORF type:complete len:198 (+),score=50.90 TRINITY_DN583_c0_g1_i2:44-595(+)
MRRIFAVAVALSLLVSIACGDAVEPFSEADYQLTFNEWKKTYGISYADADTEENSYAAFKDNVNSILADDNPTVEVDLNEYSGISSKQFILTHTGAKSPNIIVAVAAAVFALSLVAIIGIAIGCFVCVGVTGGAIAATVVHVQHKKQEEAEIEMKKPRFGVDLLGPKDSPFSITARSAHQDHL